MKALITGATGFIGSYLAEELVKRRYTVLCLVRKTSDLRWIEGLDVKLIHGDCLERESLLNAVVESDYIFHIAGLTKATNEKDFFAVNAGGTENLIRAVAEKNPNIKRFIYLSSLAATGPSHDRTPVNEDTEPKPVSAYGKSKLEAEHIVLRYKGGIPVTIIRPPAVYGPRDRDFFTFFKMLKKGIFLCWGKCYYSLLYVDDLVKGIIISAENEKAGGKTYNLSDGKIYSNYEIAEAIASAVGSKPIRINIPKALMPMFAGIGQKFFKRHAILNKDRAKDFQYPYWLCDSSKANNELGFLPKIGIKEGMKWTADWYRIHQWL
ncbi:MAG: NAD(P)-dependent oxidoreductase [Nitrospirae bacterium]|nr:NAD(P)-dependent oxidoreductase [Nitrospirota bacterium]